MNVMWGPIASIVWTALGLIAWPVLVLIPAARRHIIGVPHPSPGRTWLHGASLGEHRVIEAVRPHVGPAWVTASSWRTKVPNSFPAPLDLPGVIGPWLDKARPSRIILAEAALWPGWLLGARKRGIPVVVISGRKGPGWKRWERLGSAFKWMMRDVTFLDADQWGDLKQAAPSPSAAFSIPRHCIIAASSHPSDEALLIPAWAAMPEPRPLLVLAPRRIDRGSAIAQQLNDYRVDQRSKGSTGEGADILILDTVGELAGLLSQAEIVLVGGTFDAAIGGHSPMEAFRSGTHVIAGPHRTSNNESWTRSRWHAWCDQDATHQLHQLLTSPRPKPLPATTVSPELLQQLAPVAQSPTGPRRPWAWPLVPFWTLASRLHRRMQMGEKNSDRTIVVGGLVNGGAGRTPLVGWLAHQLNGSIVMSAGYARRKGGPHTRIGRPTIAPKYDLGDELEMLRRRGHTVISDPERDAGASEFPDAPFVLIDGGLGDPRLASAFRIACIDGHSDHWAFPAGDRRLPWSALESADAICIRNPSTALELPPGIPVATVELVPSHWIHRGETYALDAVKGPVDVAVGIAAPERFVCTLLDMGLTIRSLQTERDHAQLTALKDGAVVTEKDAARMPTMANVWALAMRVEASGFDPILQAIRDRPA